MADFLRVTQPITPKNYDYAHKTQQPQGDQVFNLGDTSKVQKPTEQTEEYAEQNLKDAEGQQMPKLDGAFSKNPVVVSALLRSIIGTDALEILKSSSSEELINKITQFASEILLKPEQVLADMLRQESETTIFSGEFFNSLKDLLAECGSMLNKTDIQLLNKGDFQLLNDIVASGLFSKEDVMNALKSSAAPVTASELQEGIKASANGMNPAEITKAIIDFMKADVNAMSRDDIVNSIATNLRYLAKEVAHSKELSDGLNTVADDLNTQNFNAYKNSIMDLLDYTQGSLILNDSSKNLIPLIIYNMSRFNGSDTALGESFNQLVNMTSGNPELSEKLSEQFVKYIENSDLPDDIKLATLKSSDSSVAHHSMTLLTDRIANSVREMSNTIVDRKDYSPDEKIDGELMREKSDPSAVAEPIINPSPNSKEQVMTPELKSYLNDLSKIISNIDSTLGTESIRQILSQITPSNMGGAINTLLRNFEQTKDLNALINRLGTIVNSIDNLDKKIMVAQGLNDALSHLATKEGVNYKPPTSMENMYDFLAKNINNPALKSLSSLDRGQMVQGLLTSPGVQTPLLHYMLPVDMDGFKAFGELWIDPNASDEEDKKRGGGAVDTNHMFLCFDIENTGYFELEVYSRDQNLNVLLLCPKGTEKQFHPLKEALPVLAEANGYHVSNAAVGPVKAKRDLGQVFPKINKKRGGLNVKI